MNSLRNIQIITRKKWSGFMLGFWKSFPAKQDSLLFLNRNLLCAWSIERNELLRSFSKSLTQWCNIKLIKVLLHHHEKVQLSFFLVMGGRILKSRPQSWFGGFCLFFLRRTFYFCIALTGSLDPDCKTN